MRVRTVTLAEVCSHCSGAPVDFLKIDVEGFEKQVIRSGDWEMFRPRVVVVEATAPQLSGDEMAPPIWIQSQPEWDGILTAEGYRCTLFDGLNRFYAQADDQQAVEYLSVPANVTDRYERFATATHIANLEA